MNISSWELCRQTCSLRNCFGATVVEPFARHLVGFILVGTVFGKAFRIFGLDERKRRWVPEHDGIFGSTFHDYLPFSPASLTESLLIVL